MFLCVIFCFLFPATFQGRLWIYVVCKTRGITFFLFKSVEHEKRHLYIATGVNRFCPENIKIKQQRIMTSGESSPGRHGRVGESHRINTPGCQTVKFRCTLHAKCQLRTNWESLDHVRIAATVLKKINNTKVKITYCSVSARTRPTDPPRNPRQLKGIKTNAGVQVELGHP